MFIDLRGKNVLVTGASSGIGLATAKLATALGARVAFCARRKHLLDEIVAQLGDTAQAIEVDVASDESVSSALSTAWDWLGSIDILVHAAGIVTPTPIADLTPEKWRHAIDINLSGAFYVMRDCGLRMQRQGSGSIVAIASDLSFKGLKYYAHYCASKAGLAGLSKALALELSPTVRVNCVCPGPVDTPMMDAELEWFGGTAELRENYISQVPLMRFATPDEIARFIIFVASEARFATGSMLSIDGGTTAR